MVCAVMLRDDVIAAECDECEARYAIPENIGKPDSVSQAPPHNDIVRLATRDDLIRMGWDKRAAWLEGETDYFDYLYA